MQYIIPFEKFHGLGNDFVIVHHTHLHPETDLPDLARRLCRRNYSIGADGLIVLTPAQESGHHAWEFINSDGSYSQMCGNGIRCLARYIYDRGLSSAGSRDIHIETRAGLVHCQVQPDMQVRVRLSPPELRSGHIPVRSGVDSVLGMRFTAVSMGNPHAVIFLDSMQHWRAIDLAGLGSQIEIHEYFPERTNVEFVYRESATSLLVKVWERGVGITLACGTGACASAVAACLLGLCQRGQDIYVQLPGGVLTVRWDRSPGQDGCVYMTGAAEHAFVGSVAIGTDH